MKRNMILVSLLIVAVAAGVAYYSRSKPAPEQAHENLAPITIGAILPLTGDAAQYGANDREGILLAVKQANQRGGVNGRHIRVAFEDCQTDGKLAISGFNRLRLKGAESVIDDAISTVSLALVPLLADNHTVLISTGASNPSLSGASPYFFRVWNSDAFEGIVTAEYLKKSAASKLAILYINSDYGKGLHDVITKELANSQVAIVASETFDKAANDFRPQVAKLRRAAPAYIYVIGYAAQIGPAVKQIREAGVKSQIVGTVAMEDPEFVKLAGKAAEGAIYPFPVAAKGRAVDAFRSAFVAEYKKDPGLLHDVGYDAANLLIQALRQGAKGGDEIRQKLEAVRDYQGASGVISFDGNHDVHKPMEMKTIQNGSFISLPAEAH